MFWNVGVRKCSFEVGLDLKWEVNGVCFPLPGLRGKNGPNPFFLYDSELSA